MALDGIMFDHLIFYPFVVMVVCVRANASVRPYIFYDVVMHEVFKGDIFVFIGIGRTNNWIVLGESH